MDRLLAHHLPSPGHRLLAAWAALGALVQACLPPLRGVDTALGPAALWLWPLPLASLALAWLLAPAPPSAAASAGRTARRSRRGKAPAPAGQGASGSGRSARTRAPARPAREGWRRAG